MSTGAADVVVLYWLFALGLVVSFFFLIFSASGFMFCVCSLVIYLEERDSFLDKTFSLELDLYEFLFSTLCWITFNSCLGCQWEFRVLKFYLRILHFVLSQPPCTWCCFGSLINKFWIELWVSLLGFHPHHK